MNEYTFKQLERLESPGQRYRGQKCKQSPDSPMRLAREAHKPSSGNMRRSLHDESFTLSPPMRSKRNEESMNDNSWTNVDNNASTSSNMSIQSGELPEIPLSMKGDRHIPCRTFFNADVANFNLEREAYPHMSLDTSPAKELYKRQLGSQLFGIGARRGVLPLAGTGVLDEPTAHRHAQLSSHVRLLDAAPRNRIDAPQRKCHRSILRTAVRILDAPDMFEDYYLNLLDWSRDDVLAVGLNKVVYLWNAGTGAITKLLELTRPESYVASLRWTAAGDCLAVGTSESEVQLWDVAALRRVRTLRGHQGRVSALAWHGSTLASGSRDALVRTYDARANAPLSATLSRHTQEVCGLQYNADGLLASGGNDNLLNIWEPMRAHTPRHTLDHHVAAVKGLAWCPWAPNLLASGGGTADRTLRFWDAGSGACLNHIDTKSQVCAILWSPHYRELVSSHGFSQNQLIVWKYPSMVKVCELTGHTSRVLHMAMSPDGETVCSASGDETLRFWHIFERRRAGANTPNVPKAPSCSLPSITLR